MVKNVHYGKIRLKPTFTTGSFDFCSSCSCITSVSPVSDAVTTVSVDIELGSTFGAESVVALFTVSELDACN